MDIPENLVSLLERAVANFGARPLFGTKNEGGWEWIRYDQFGQRVAEFSSGLAELGVQPGQAVAIVSDNRLEWAVAAYATYARGARYVPMYASQKPEEWRFILQDSEASAVIAETGRIEGLLRDVADELPKLRSVIGVHDDSGLSFAAVCERGRENPSEPLRPDPDDIAGLIYTSGTTGQPKGVMLSHRNICSNVLALAEIFPIRDETALSFLPWAHSFGQNAEMHNLINSGCAMAINDDLGNLLPNLAEVKPTLLFAVPRIFNRIYDGIGKQIAERPAAIQRLFERGLATARGQQATQSVGLLDRAVLWLVDRMIFSKVRDRFGGRLRYAVSGSAALSRDVAEFISALGIRVYEGYGLTETSPVVTTNHPDAHRMGSVGITIPGVRVAIDPVQVGDEDAQDGEVVVYGPNVMCGYHKRPHETDEVLMADGGFRTGDLGRVDEDGFLYITGRIKEQYKLENGKYVVPSPIEEKLKLSPYIANAFLYGDNRPFNVTLLVPDADAVQGWAEQQSLDLASQKGREALLELLAAELSKYSVDFKGYEKAKRFALANEDFSAENGLLTPTLKLRRDKVLARYADVISELYR